MLSGRNSPSTTLAVASSGKSNLARRNQKEPESEGIPFVIGQVRGHRSNSVAHSVRACISDHTNGRQHLSVTISAQQVARTRRRRARRAPPSTRVARAPTGGVGGVRRRRRGRGRAASIGRTREGIRREAALGRGDASQLEVARGRVQKLGGRLSEPSTGGAETGAVGSLRCTSAWNGRAWRASLTGSSTCFPVPPCTASTSRRSHGRTADFLVAGMVTDFLVAGMVTDCRRSGSTERPRLTARC